jgi:uncharacterized protein (DUF1015 family)
MPGVHPFQAIVYAQRRDVSSVIAPPYDVLDAAGKARLLALDPDNIAGVDLPHVPAKSLGPPEAYARAAGALQSMLERGVLARQPGPVMIAYRQTFAGPDGKTPVQRSGMACVIDAVAFGPRDGGGVLPHEQTFSGPKEDRLALMRATRAQLSPVFGLVADERGEADAAVRGAMADRPPDLIARTTETDGTTTLHEAWIIADNSAIAEYQRSVRGQDVLIADGHHRYTTALTYAQEVNAPAGHPSRRVLAVLVSMSDPGLMIRPTHRVLAGMSGWSMEAFVRASAGVLSVRPAPGTGPAALLGLEREMSAMTMPPPPLPRTVLGLYDYASGRAYTAHLVKADPLAATNADKPRAWRELDVAIVQHAIVEGVCVPTLNDGRAVQWAFPHTLDEMAAIGRGQAVSSGGGAGFVAQLGVVVRPTPLSAVRECARAGVVMPQKSTFFFPKLATGMFLHGLE